MAITDIDNIDKIEGATDGTPIGNVGDRLKVDSNNLTPKELLFEQFRAGGVPSGSDNLSADGSTTPINYDISAHATKDKYINHIDFYAVVKDDVALSTTKFLNINILTNGIELKFKTQDVVYNPISNIKRTEHLLGHFSHGSEYIWEEEANFTFIKVSMDLKDHPIVVKSQAEGYTTNDYLRAIVQDDITDAKIEEIEMTVKGFYL